VSERWSVLAGSSAGGAHARAGVSGQDAFAVKQVGGMLVLAVADGAGSAPYAAVGASLVVRLAVAALAPDRPLDDPTHWTALLDAGSGRLLSRFRRATRAVTRWSGLRPRDLATTVTVVVAYPPWVAALAVGDGVVVVRAADGNLDLLLAPEGGPHRPPGMTALLPMAKPSQASRVVAHLPDLTGIAVCTDGLTDLLVEYTGARPRRPATAPFARLFAMAEDAGTDPMAVTRLLSGSQVAALTDDDRTMVLAVPR
jgi:hypothetical protein